MTTRALHSTVVSRAGLSLALLALASVAQAGSRQFEPVPRSKAQVVQVLGERTIVSARGAAFDAGASLAGDTSRRAWLAVSIKNTRGEPVLLPTEGIRVLADGQPLAIVDAEPVAKDKDVDVDVCASATSTSVVRCGVDAFNRRQQERAEEVAGERIAPGQLLTRQFEVVLPKKSRNAPAKLTVAIVVAGEELAFDFAEVE